MRFHQTWFVRFARAFFFIAGPAATLVVHGQTTIAGKLEDRFSVSSGGSVNYRIPIPVPPGTAGLQPELAVVYFGRPTLGLAGLGWGMAGLSSISRCPRTLSQDGARGAVNFDANDRFCLDGKRLMLVSGTYGQDGAVYRPELDDFTKVVSYGVAGSGPSYFKAWTTSGQILEFGNTVDSKVEVVAAQSGTPQWSAGTVREWAVNKVSDPHGNTMTMQYDEDAVNGVYRPSRIDYGANAVTASPHHSYVTFSYAAISNPIAKYRAGAISKANSRLSQVATFSNGTAAHVTNLSYSESSPTLAPRLESLQMCDASSSCLPAVTFTYAMPSSNFATTSDPWALPSGSAWPFGGSYQQVSYAYYDTTEFGVPEVPRMRTQTHVSTVDMNGDGLPDLFWTPSHPSIPGAYPAKVYLNIGSGFASSASSWPLPDQIRAQRDTVSNLTISQLADLNGDGLPDLYQTMSSLGPSSKRSRVFFNTGSGFSSTPVDWNLPTAVSTPNQGAEETASAIIDMNGDGLPDVYYTNGNPGDVYLNTGTGFSNVATPWPLPPGSSSPMTGGATQKHVYTYFDVTEFGVPEVPRYRTQTHVALVDMNGDGLPDLYWTPFHPYAPGAYTAKVYFNTGTAFASTATPWPLPAGVRAQRDVLSNMTIVQLVDMNGDGLPDIYKTMGGFGPASERGLVYFNTGNGFSTTPVDWGLPQPLYVSNHGSAETSSALVDMDGDGLPDAFRTSGSEPETVFLNRSVAASQLVRIESATSPSVDISYGKLTNAAIYTKDVGPLAAVPPQIDLGGGRKVVTAVSVDNGIGGARSTTYKYGGLKAELGTGRGLLGFRWLSATDSVTGLETYTESRQDFPYTGLPVKSELRRIGSGDGGVLKRTTYTLGCQDQSLGTCTTAAGKRYFPYVASTVENNWDLNGSQFVTRSTTSVFGQNPQYGAPTSTTISFSDGTSETTVNEYWPADTVNWIVNRLKKATVTSTIP